jgi:hypothetical protein
MTPRSPHPSPRSVREAGRDAALTRCWPSVAVVAADVVSHPSGRHARAVIQLGGLTPADVQVELRSVSPSGQTTGHSADACLRMWSTQSYENGCFVFETPLPASGCTPSSEWMLRVRAPASSIPQQIQYPCTLVT